MNKQIENLKKLLKEKKLDAYIVPSNDEFHTSYNESTRLRYLTNFTGSAGTAVITTSQNYFFTDGRYTQQAAEELDKDFQIINIKEQPLINWLTSFINKGNNLGFDPKLHSISQIQNLKANIKSKAALIPIKKNLIITNSSYTRHPSKSWDPG